MKIKRLLRKGAAIVVLSCLLLSTAAQQKKNFNNNWEFFKDKDTSFSIDLSLKKSTIKWDKISLPHTANIEPIEKVNQQWQGICFYRKFFAIPVTDKGKHIALQFDAAMQEADVYLNGKHIYNHKGGYLPFYIDISMDVKFGAENNVVVKLDNRDKPLFAPGKPIKDLDFNYYSGIYRNTWLIVKEKLYISNAVAANTKAGGGVFIHYDKVTDKSATIVVQTQIQNDFSDAKNAQLKITLKEKTGKIIAQSISKNELVEKGNAVTIAQKMEIINPALWSPATPYLYTLSIDLLQDGKLVDSDVLKTGIKTIRFEAGVFYLNGKKLVIRGTNRNQEYPYVGNAASDNAQYRDAWKIKQAGFNFVRFSHYPQSPAYLNACDELGIMAMDAIPGWQFVGNDIFKENSYQDIRDMIRRDRNHSSIILWEASLNESDMKVDYMTKAHAIVHEESPFGNTYSAGWMDTVYDVFLPARQHVKAPDYWRKYSKNKPFIIAEYGDWEYYAQNGGFNQTQYQDLKKEDRTSRQLLGYGEKRLLQQALNFQEAHNDNMYSPAVGDANWLMFDYNRGYAADIESSGIMDMVRLPKFSFYFYQSQIDPIINKSTPFNKPMLFIANYWQNGSDTAVKIFSNCTEVELLLNGKSLGMQSPNKDQYATNLKHAPFTFHLPKFTPGALKAIGYINHKKVTQQIRNTPGETAAISIRVDYSGKNLKAGANDLVFVYATITDKDGTVINNAKDEIEFKVTGDATIIGQNPRMAEAGTATILLKAGSTPGKIYLSAVAKNIKETKIVIISK